jgi:hypothetical protein
MVFHLFISQISINHILLKFKSLINCYSKIKRAFLHVYKSISFKSMSNYPKKLNGLCIGVLSGDRVLFQGPVDQQNGGFKQKILHLTAINAPKVDPANGND